MLQNIGYTGDKTAVANDIWLSTIRALKSTQAGYAAVPLRQVKPKRNPAHGKRGVDAYADGTTVAHDYEKQMSSRAFQELMPEFEQLTQQIQTAFQRANIQDARSWGFWSGNNAKNAAKEGCEMSLEGGFIGAAFDNINITGGWDIQLWGALSKAYAQAAVKRIQGREFHIYVGAGQHHSENIWAQIESKEVYAVANRNPDMVFDVHAVIHSNSTQNLPEEGGAHCFWVKRSVPAGQVEATRMLARIKANQTVPGANGPTTP